jgi:hypothetical protein
LLQDGARDRDSGRYGIGPYRVVVHGGARDRDSGRYGIGPRVELLTFSAAIERQSGMFKQSLDGGVLGFISAICCTAHSVNSDPDLLAHP